MLLTIKKISKMSEKKKLLASKKIKIKLSKSYIFRLLVSQGV